MKYLSEIENLINDLTTCEYSASNIGACLFEGETFSFDYLAWLAFEETARHLANTNGVEW